MVIPGPGSGSSGTMSSPRFQHVFVVVLENQDYASVVGNSAMPYLNSLAQRYGLATQYFANTHPSIGNYFMMTTGQIISNDDGFAGSVDADNVVRVLTAAGKTWKVYAQSLPSTGYVGGDAYPYIKHHNPFAYFTDVTGSQTQRNNLVDLGQLATDTSAGQLPNYGFIVPDNLHNAHDCPDGSTFCSNNQKLAAADGWLQQNLASLLASSAFGSDSLLIVAFDESALDLTLGGGRVAVVLASSKSKMGFNSTATYQHQSLLAACLRQLGLTAVPGAGGSASAMDEFFN
jgi:phosphatidylinositol-3-phosphatase